MTAPEIVTTVAELRARVAGWRRKGERVGLVPTMGALHAGHLSLVGMIRTRTDRVIASIFVNPTQFAPHEDFDRYPRALEDDAAKLDGAVELVFAPAVREMYPEGFATRVDVAGPAAGLESDFRPHFLSGVATVVSKLLIAAMPDVAIFGEKDYQQLLVIRRMTADLGLPIAILGAPVVREADGLALSSRNAYLSPEQRIVAGRLNAVLKAVIARARAGQLGGAEEYGVNALLKAGFDSVDYLALRDKETLQPVVSLARPARILAAAKIGGTRLIDNMEIPPSP
jgi:pantoate--beta-alanine ligase